MAREEREKIIAKGNFNAEMRKKIARERERARRKGKKKKTEESKRQARMERRLIQ